MIDVLNEAVFFDGLSKAIVLIPRVCMVVMAAYVSMRVTLLRQALSNRQLYWQHRLFASLFFGILAIIGTHSGIKVDIHQGETIANWTPDIAFSLEEGQIIIGFRDLMVFTAGLFGGPWIGLGTGLLAGVERYYIDGGAVKITGVGTIILGLSAGLSRQLWPQWTTSVKGILVVTIVGTLGLVLFLSIFVPSHTDAMATIREMIIPESLVNSLGCLLFMVVMKDLENDQLKIAAQQSELRALRAQIEPHFLNNILNDLNYLIHTDPNTARRYVIELADFFRHTHKFARENTISLQEEVEQLQRYLALQTLGYGNKLQARTDIPDHLKQFAVLSGCLITLVENALKHAFRGRKPPYELHVSADETDSEMILYVRDNGRGLPPERIAELGKSPVPSANNGSGFALYQLRQSLEIVFGVTARLHFESDNHTGTLVSLILPKRSLV